MKPNLLLAAIAAVIGLSACANLDGKPAHELMKISRDRVFTKDYSFNVQGEASAQLSPISDGTVAETAKEETEHKEAESLERSFAESIEMFEQYKKSPVGWIVDFVQKYPALENHVSSSRIKYSGAADLSSKEVEIVPEFSLENRNQSLRLAFPIYFNAKKMQLTADFPAAVPLFLNFLTEDPVLRRLVDEPIRVDIAKIEALRGMPLKHGFEAALRAATAAENDLPPEAFAYKEMDGYGRKHGARYRVHYVFNRQYENMTRAAFLKHFEKQLNLLQQNPEAGSTAEGYDKIREAVKGIYGLAGELQENHAEAVPDNPIYIDYYLDRKGRTKAIRTYTKFNGKTHALNLVADVVYSNYGKPVFRFRSQTARAVDFKELAESMKKGKPTDE